MFKGRSLVFGKRTPETVPPFGEAVSYVDFNALQLRVTSLENNEYKIVYYEEINSTTGTITIPTGATILLDEFSGGIDAFVSEIENGEPNGIFPKDANNIPIDVVSFDAGGNYNLSGTPSNYPVALIYTIKIKAIDLVNLNIDYIIEEDEVNEENILNYRYEISNASLIDDDDIIECNGNFNLILPALNTISYKQRHIVNSGTGIITVIANGMELIYDVSSFDLYPGESLLLLKGSNWLIG